MRQSGLTSSRRDGVGSVFILSVYAICYIFCRVYAISVFFVRLRGIATCFILVGNQKTRLCKSMTMITTTKQLERRRMNPGKTKTVRTCVTSLVPSGAC